MILQDGSLAALPGVFEPVQPPPQLKLLLGGKRVEMRESGLHRDTSVPKRLLQALHPRERGCG
jgi:hypothetical protein